MFRIKDILTKMIGKMPTALDKTSGTNDREQLRQRFNGEFRHWDIELPIDAMEPGVVWLIVKRGWTIWTRFDVEDGRERLDYYAMHRMTDDSHVRMYVDRDDVRLPAMSGWCVIPKGATEAEAEAQYYAHNQSVAKLLEEKGFVMTDQAHGSAIVNRYLQTHPEALRRKKPQKTSMWRKLKGIVSGRRQKHGSQNR